MKIDVTRETGSARVQLEGRLDREWAEHLSHTLEDLVHGGVRSVTLDCSGVTYVSSAATRVLTRWREEFALLRGEVRLSDLPAAARDALAAAGWDSGGAVGETPGVNMRDLRRSSWQATADLATSGQYEMSACTPAGTLTCHLHGSPAQLTQAALRPEDCGTVALAPDNFGLGLGAIGGSYEECHERFGELIAVAGGVAYFPSDGARKADYLLGGERVVPKATLASGLTFRGGFSKLVRFSTQPEAEAVPLSELATVGLKAAGGRIAGMVIAGETLGLCGARLLRSPGSAAAPLRFDVPDVRAWLSFAPQRIHQMTTALIVGVVARRPEGPLAAYLRPIEGADGLYGHFHAAVFSYHPLPQRTIELPVLLDGLFANHELRDVLHLVSDNRGAEGVGESALVRGVGWVAPITSVD